MYDTYIASVKEASVREYLLPLNFLSDIGSVGGKTKSCLELSKELGNAFDMYYSGYGDERMIEETIASVVADLRQPYIDLGFDEAEFMPQLLEDVYATARIHVVSGAGTASWQEGCAVAGQYTSHDPQGRESIYYNADYYYRSEAMKDTLQDIVRKIGAKYGVAESELDLPRGYPEGDIRKNYYESYNSYINDRARETAQAGNMLDESLVPPKRLRFLFQGNDRGVHPFGNLTGDGSPESSFDGILRIWYGDWSFAGRVPVRMDSTRFPISVNMYDAVQRASASIPGELVPFMQNFDFFSFAQHGSYLNTHPRKFA